MAPSGASTAPTPGTTISWFGTTESLQPADGLVAAGVMQPPDCNMAAGTHNVVTIVNDTIDVYDRSGNSLSSQSLNAFFGVPSTDFVFDPRIMWDSYHGRFIATADDQNNPASSVLIAASRDSNPADGWWTYNISVARTNNNQANWLDYPVLGLDGSTLYFSGNYFTFPPEIFTGWQLWAYDLNQLESGQSANGYTYTTGPALYTPAHMYGDEAGVNGDFMVNYAQNNNGNDTLNIFVAGDPASGSTVSGVQSLNVGNISDLELQGAQQSGTPITINVNQTDQVEHVILDAVWRDNRLYAVTDIRANLDNTSARDMVHWFVVDTSNPNNLTLLSQGNVDYGAGTDTYFGNMTVDNAGNMIIGYSFSGTNTFASSAYALITAGGTALQDSGFFLTQGLGTYTVNNAEGRWGDYSGVSIDPTNYRSFWAFNQYATSSNTWATTVGGVVYPSAILAHDFSGDGSSDLLWRNTSGEVDSWFMDNDRMNGGTVVGSVSNAWQFAGTGDFDGNGTGDLLWRNTTTGEVDTWLIGNGRVIGGNGVGHVTSAWTPLGAGDFNGDGTSDFLWRNTNSGEVDTWLMQNGHVTGGSAIGSVSSAWRFAGIGDFTDGGTSDVLWQNTATGEVDTWLMQNGHVTGGGAIGHASSVWQPLGVGDFTGGGIGTRDVLWRNTSTGEVDDWLLQNGQMIGGNVLGSVSNAWQLASVGYCNGDGSCELTWRNTGGQIDIWRVSNGQLSGGGGLGTCRTRGRPCPQPSPDP